MSLKNHLYEIATGELLSSTILPITKLKEGKAFVSLPDGDESGIWNTETLRFDPRPIDMRESGGTFWNRLTESEQENLVEAAISIPKAAALLKAMSYPAIDRSDSRVINRINAMESAGKLDYVGRAAEILE